MAMERWRPFGTTMERWDPFHNNGADIQSEVNRLFGNFFGRPSSASAQGGRAWAPAVDMYETKG